VAIGFINGIADSWIYFYYMVCRKSLSHRHPDVRQKTNVERNDQVGIQKELINQSNTFLKVPLTWHFFIPVKEIKKYTRKFCFTKTIVHLYEQFRHSKPKVYEKEFLA
jgi:hypothetical protein